MNWKDKLFLTAEQVHEIDRHRQYKDLPEFYSENESPFESDYDRLIHSPTFRRLQGKRQMIPTGVSDFFRNRLSHSVELTCYAKQIATMISRKYPDRSDINIEVLNFACLAHDLGHPPFGHLGDKILTEVMADSGGYEGNAQTLRLLTSIEKGLINDRRVASARNRMGLNLSNRSILSILKYNWILGENPAFPEKGYFADDDFLIKSIWAQYGIDTSAIPVSERPKSIECRIMDLADDITNSLMDLEDNLKRGIVNLFNLFFPSETLLDALMDKVHFQGGPDLTLAQKQSAIFKGLNLIFNESDILPIEENKSKWVRIIGVIYRKTQKLATNGFERTRFVRKLTNEFINGIVYEPNDNCLLLSKVHFSPEVQMQVDILKAFQVIFDHQSVNTKELDYQGKRLIRKLFEAFSTDVMTMPEDFQNWYLATSDIEGLSFHLAKIGETRLLDGISALQTVETYSKSGSALHRNEIMMGRGEKRNLNDIHSIREFREFEVEDYEKEYKEIIYRFRKRVICDHVACMTDSYCEATFDRLFSTRR